MMRASPPPAALRQQPAQKLLNFQILYLFSVASAARPQSHEKYAQGREKHVLSNM